MKKLSIIFAIIAFTLSSANAQNATAIESSDIQEQNLSDSSKSGKTKKSKKSKKNKKSKKSKKLKNDANVSADKNATPPVAVRAPDSKVQSKSPLK